MAVTDREYWVARAEQHARDAHTTVDRYLGTLRGSYATATRDIRNQISAFYDNYAGKTGITYAQAVQRLSTAEQRILQTSAQEIAQRLAGGDTALKEDLLAFVKKRQVNRLEGLDAEVRTRLVQLAGIQESGIAATLKTGLLDTYYQNMYTIQQGIGVGVRFGGISDTKVNAILQTPWNGANYSTRVWSNTETLANSIRQELTQGIIRGDSSQDMAARIADRMNVGYSASERLVRTEMTHIAAEADILSYKDAGIDRYEYLATLDNRTSEICGGLDGQTFGVEDAQAGINLPPMHPNCRSTTVADFGKDMKAGLERRARDLSGQPGSYMVPADMKYSQWKQQQQKTISITSTKDLSDKELDALINYTNMGYDTMNKYLRFGNKVNSSIVEQTELLKKALERSVLPDAITVYRGVKYDALGTLADILANDASKAIGNEILEKGFMSTSRSRGVAFGFIEDYRDKAVILDISVPKGYNGLDVSSISEHPEEEILLRANTRLRIVDAFRTDDGYMTVVAEVIT